MPENQLEQIANGLIDRARRAGATAADAVVREGDEFSTAVRLGQIESLKEAASKVLGLRVFLSARSATAFSSDFSPASLARLVERTLEMARVTSEDPASGLPEAELLGRYEGDLDLYSADVGAMPTEERIAMPRRSRRTCASGIPRERGLQRRRAPKPTRIRSASRAAIALRIARSRSLPLRRTARAGCSVITGIRWRGALRRSIRPKPSAARRRNARCGGWARARFRPAAYP